MMKMTNMTWGYDGGGMACGPVAGSSLAEITFLDHENEKFVLASDFEGNVQVRIANESMFEISMNLMRADDFDEQLDRLNSLTEEQYDWSDEYFEGYREIFSSEYSGPIQLAIAAVRLYNSIAFDEEEAECSKFNKRYAGVDLKTLTSRDLPAFSQPWDRENDPRYEDDLIKAEDVKAWESDPCGWASICVTDCKVTVKASGEVVYPSILIPGDADCLEIRITDERYCENVDDEQFEDIAVLEIYSSLEEAKKSDSYEAIRRLMFTFHQEF